MFDCDDGGIEAVRLFTIKELDILDTPNEAIYDDIVTHAIDCAQTSIAAISIVADDRQWFKARVGLELQETSRSVSFCDHAIRSSDMLIVDDAAKDERFALNPLVTGAPFIRFYAGIPLEASNGIRVGTLCIMDKIPRAPLTAVQVEALKALGRRTMEELENRKKRPTSVSSVIPEENMRSS